MKERLAKAIEKAIDQLVSDFQNRPDRYWNERDLHWILYYRLREERVFKENDPFGLIRAEFPTLKKYNGRGHYDLAILDPLSFYSEDVAKLTIDASWDEFLSKVRVLFALELKLWQDRSMGDKVEWDIEKLTDAENKVVHPYFLNFVQLKFDKPEMRRFYEELRERLASLASKSLRILCVPNDVKIQSNPNQNWL